MTKLTFEEWQKTDIYKEKLEELKKKNQICFYCGKSLYPINGWEYYRKRKNFLGINKPNKSPHPLYMCDKHATEEIYEEYKDNFLVEEYNGYKIYFYNDLYFPYFLCYYGFETIEGCRNRLDHSDCVFYSGDISF